MKRDLWRGVPVALLAALAVAFVAMRLSRHAPDARDARASSTSSASSGRAPDARAAIAIAPSASGASATPPIRMQHGDRKRAARENVRGPSALDVKWKSDLQDGAIETQPIPSPDESVIYVATLGSNHEGHLVAIDRATGAPKLRVALGGRSYATPCVDDNGTVYSASDAKKLFAVKPDGSVAWTLDLDDEGDTACAIAADRSIVLAAGRTLYDVRANGDVAWRFSARGKIFTAPAIDDGGRVIVGSQDHHAYAIDHGSKMWSVDLGADVDGAPAIDDDGTCVVGTDAGDVVKLDAGGGVIFSTMLGGFVRGALSIARGGDVIAGVYGPRARVVRLDGKTGKEKASFDVAGTGALEFGVHGGALEDAEGKLYFGAQDDRLYAFAPSQPEPIFALRTGGDVDAPATLLADGALVVASDDGVVYYLSPQAR